MSTPIHPMAESGLLECALENVLTSSGMEISPARRPGVASDSPITVKMEVTANPTYKLTFIFTTM